MAKIPTELYICIVRRSSYGAFHTNAWVNLTRKDTGEGIGPKPIYLFLDGVQVGPERYTSPGNGYAGPLDLNPKTEGLHKAWVEFPGDTEFEPCKSEEITLEVNPTLKDLTEFSHEITPVSGPAPLTIRVTGFIGMAYGKPIGYQLPLDLMVFEDKTSTRSTRLLKRFLSHIDGTYEVEYTFSKPGTYLVGVVFLGDNKYRSDWSNNGRTTFIEVKGGELPLSFEKPITITRTESIKFKWILASTEPAAPEGYERFPDLDLDFGVLGKYWCFIKTSV